MKLNAPQMCEQLHELQANLAMFNNCVLTISRFNQSLHCDVLKALIDYLYRQLLIIVS